MAQLFPGIQSSSKSKERTAQEQSRAPKPFERLPLGILLRAIIGQMTQPPNTAISVPTQQALSNLQGGGMAMANAFGIGGTGRGQTSGLQTRAQMGLPDRSSYFGAFMPTVQDIQALGLPPLPVTTTDPNIKAARKAAKQGGKAGKAAERQKEASARSPGG